MRRARRYCCVFVDTYKKMVSSFSRVTPMFVTNLSTLSLGQVDGTKQQPITLKGPSSGATAIIKGSDKSGTCVEINHDYYILDVSEPTGF